MIVRQEIDFNEPLTDSQVKMLHKLAERPVTPDEGLSGTDCGAVI